MNHTRAVLTAWTVLYFIMGVTSPSLSEKNQGKDEYNVGSGSIGTH